MDFTIEYEIAAACILAIFLIAYRMKNHLRTKLNKIFMGLMLSVLLIDIVDIMSVLVDRAASPAWNWMVYGMNILLFLLQPVMYLLFLLFVLTLTRVYGKLRRWIVGGLLAATVIYLLLVSTTPFTHAVFYMTGDGRYCFGKLHGIVYIVSCLFLTACFMMLIFRRRMMKRAQMISSCLFSGIILCATIVQAVLIPHILISYFFTTLGLLLIYFVFQAPEYYLDHVTDAFNDKGLQEILKERFLSLHPVFLAVVHPSNTELICGADDQFTLDQIMITLKKEIETALPDVSCMYRLNDAFCLLFEKDTDSLRAAETILAGLSNKYFQSAGRIPIEADILLLDAPVNFKSFEELHSIIRYFCKNAAKNGLKGIVTCDDEFIQRKKRYETICRIVKAAIRDEAISICYQPIYSTEEKGFHSAEALVRLDDVTTIGRISPEEFIPIVENENLIFDLGMLVLKKVCGFSRKYRLRELGVQHVAVNLSVKQCMQGDLYRQIEGVMNEYGMEPSFLAFELTETVIIGAKKTILRNMEQLLEQGCIFALDDFGSGYANLNYLLEFPFRSVKLDKELVWSYFRKENKKSKTVLEYTIRMLNAMGMTIVAEGIEDEEMNRTLTAAGIPYLQGYYFSTPLSEADYLCFLRDNHPY